MRQMVIVAAIVGAIVMILGFFLVGDNAERGARDTSDVSRPGASTPAEEARPEVDLAETASPGEAAGSGLVAEAAADIDERTVIEAESLSVEDSILLRVLRADNSEPVPSAEVLALVVEPGDKRDAFNNLADVDAWMEERAVRLFADDQGELRVPASAEGRTLVLGRDEGLWGKGSFKKPTAELVEELGDEIGPFHLKLVPDRDLEVQVVDQTGAPVEGITVELGRLRRSWVSNLEDRETDGRGLARFRHVNAHRRWDAEDPELWEVAVETLLEQEVAEVIEVEDLPTSPMRFVIPATGTVAVRVLDLDGNPWIGEANVRLAVIREGERKEVSPFASNKRPSMARKPEEGVAVFPHVGLGLELAAAVTRDLGSVQSHGYEAGPIAADERVDFAVTLGIDHPVIQVRVVGESGAPLLGEKVGVRTDASSSQMLGGSYTQWPTSDPEGRIQIDLSPSWGEGDTRVATLSLGPKEAPTASASLELSRSFESGLTDLGDVQLFAPRLFVAGQVLDEAGRPVASARVTLSRRKESRGWWDEIWDFQHQTDEQGRFEAYQSHEGEEFRVGASKQAMAGSPVQFQPGDSSVLIRLAAAGDILGSVLLDDGIPTDSLRVEASPAEGDDQGHFINYGKGQATLDGDGTFELDDLQPGSYDIFFRLDGDSDNLLAVQQVLVLGGQDTRDPRLQAIDLRGKLHAFHFTLVPPDGGRDATGNVKFGEAGAEELQNWHWFHSTEFDLVSQSAAIDVDVLAQGYRSEELRNVRDDVTLELSRGISVRIVLRGDAEIPKPPFYVKPALVPVEGDGNIDWGADSFDETREVVVRAVTPGRNRVRWVLERRSAQGAMAMSVDSDPEIFIEVLPGVEDQVFEVSVTAEQMKAIVESLSF